MAMLGNVGQGSVWFGMDDLVGSGSVSYGDVVYGLVR